MRPALLFGHHPTAPLQEVVALEPVWRALLDAARRGNAVQLRRLLAAPPRCDSDEGESCEMTWSRLDQHHYFSRRAVHHAASGGHVGCLRELLLAGCSPSFPDMAGYTPLMMAASGGCEACVRVLLAAHVDPSVQDQEEGGSALHHAATSGSPGCINALIAAGAAMEAVNHDGRTPLLCAAEAGKAAGVRTLLAARANPAAVDRWGDTAMCLAAPHVGCVRALLAAGCSVHATDFQGWGPVHSAAWSGAVPSLHVLAEAGAKLTSLTDDAETPLQLAEKGGHQEAAALLRQLTAGEGRPCAASRRHELQHALEVPVNLLCTAAC